MTTVLPVAPNRTTDAYVEVYRTDRNNIRRDLLGVVGETVMDIGANWDIDRSGSKAAANITAQGGVLEPGMWIAPYVTITPEVGEVTRQQMGHFRLGKPGIRYSGSQRSESDQYLRIQSATGADIVDDLAAVKLQETFYTPIDGNIMSDVGLLIRMATCGVTTFNQVADPSFNQQGTYWTQSHLAGAGSMLWTYPGNTPVPKGKYMAGMLFNSGRAIGDYMRIYQDVMLPQNSNIVLIFGLAFRGSSLLTTQMIAQFQDESGANIGSAIAIANGDVYQQWKRHYAFLAVPVGAVQVRVWCRAHTTATTATTAYAAFEDIHVHRVSMMPINDDRINLPQSSVKATTFIQTAAGKNLCYDGINSDRLNALGYHSIYADLEGVLTTRIMRNASEDYPDRVYGNGDVNIVGEVEIAESSANVPNHFMAIKEDSQNAASSMVAISYNNSPNDWFSVVNTERVVSADIIYIPDAVDINTLKAAATAARDRQSMREQITFQLMPDLALQVHAVVEITDTTKPEAMGKWGIEEITPGMKPDSALVTVTARRTIGGTT
jgi:hypothetical protein